MFYLNDSKVDLVLQTTVRLLLLVRRRGSRADASTARIHKQRGWAGGRLCGMDVGARF